MIFHCDKMPEMGEKYVHNQIHTRRRNELILELANGMRRREVGSFFLARLLLYTFVQELYPFGRRHRRRGNSVCRHYVYISMLWHDDVVSNWQKVFGNLALGKVNFLLLTIICSTLIWSCRSAVCIQTFMKFALTIKLFIFHNYEQTFGASRVV